MEWQVICTMFKTPPGAQPSEREPSSTDLQYARPCVPPGWRAPTVQWGRNAADLCASGITCQRAVKIYRREIYNEEVRACKWALQVCGLRLFFFHLTCFAFLDFIAAGVWTQGPHLQHFFVFSHRCWNIFSQLGNAFYVTLTRYIWHIMFFFISWCVLHDC